MKNIALKLKKLGLPFLIIVVLPTILSVIYYGFIAANQYISVSNFVVRSPQKNTSVSGLSAVLQGVGFSRSQDDAHIVTQYMLSRDALNTLDKELNLKEKYRHSGIDLFGKFNPLGLDDSSESLYDFYKKKVGIDLDSSSSISTLTVRAYTPEDAYTINNRLLNMAEVIVNQLNERGRKDTIAYAEKELAQAEKNLQVASTELAMFRSKNQIFDVDKQATIQLQMVSKLQDQLLLVRSQLAQIRAVTPENPQIRVLQEREKLIKQEIQAETNKALGAASINEKSTDYEKLALGKEIAAKQLTAALASLEQSKNDAARKQLYLERIAQPNMPDYAAEPRRLRSILSVFLLGLVFWGIFSMLMAGVREHND